MFGRHFGSADCGESERERESIIEIQPELFSNDLVSFSFAVEVFSVQSPPSLCVNLFFLKCVETLG